MGISFVACADGIKNRFIGDVWGLGFRRVSVGEGYCEGRGCVGKRGEGYIRLVFFVREQVVE